MSDTSVAHWDFDGTKRQPNQSIVMHLSCAIVLGHLPLHTPINFWLGTDIVVGVYFFLFFFLKFLCIFKHLTPGFNPSILSYIQDSFKQLYCKLSSYIITWYSKYIYTIVVFYLMFIYLSKHAYANTVDIYIH